MSIKIGKLYDYVCEYLQIEGKYEEEIDVKSIGMTIEGVDGQTNINYIIKKKCQGLKLTFDNGTELICAKRHILFNNNDEVYAEQLSCGDFIDGKESSMKVVSIEDSDVTDYYDISVDYPHIYFDANGIKHHNTLITASICHKIKDKGNIIIIVPGKDLCYQTANELKLFGLDTGIVGMGLREFGHNVTLCTWQTIHSIDKRGKTSEVPLNGNEIKMLLDGVVSVIFDEVHTAKSNIVRSIMENIFINVPIRYGLTGTINKDKADYYSLITSFGPVFDEKVTSKELQDKGFLSKCKVSCINLEDTLSFASYTDEAKYLSTNKDRMTFLASLIGNITQTSGNTLVLVNYISTGVELEKQLLAMGVDAIFLNGNVKTTKRFEEYESIKKANNRCIIATVQIASTGLNIPRLFNLVMLDIGKSFTRTIQGIGRSLRRASDKDFANIFDITSTTKYASQHHKQRLRYYKEAQYPYDIINIKTWK